MKSIITTSLALILTFTCLSAQNILFREFGTSYAEVEVFLSERSEVNCNFSEKDQIIAYRDNYFIVYHFNQDNELFKIKLFKNFNDKKDTEAAFEGFTNYYTLMKAKILNFEESKDGSSFIALKGDEVHEVYIFPLGKKDYQVKLVSQSMEYAPDKSDDKQDSPEDIKMFTSLVGQ